MGIRSMAAVLAYLALFCALCFGSAIAQLSGASNSSSFSSSIPKRSWQTWGPYRPNLYFGVRPQVPVTLLMGLMWASGESRDEMLNTLRDTCEQNDGMQGYGWNFYDVRVGGSQTMHDTQLQLDLSTDFLKAEDGGSWAVRITGTPNPGAAGVKTTVILHAAAEMADSEESKSLVCENHTKDQDGVDVACRGEMAGLGRFEFQVLGDATNNVVHETVVKSIQVPEDKIWQAKSVFSDQVNAAGGDHVTIQDAPGAGNMHFVQTTFQGPFQLTFTYHAEEASLLDTKAVADGIDSLRRSFPTSVDKVFPRLPPFQGEEYARFPQEILSNLLGGLGFFHGDTKVDESHAPEYDETDLEFWTKTTSAMSRALITTTEPKTLLSFTPSRPFFPRGFLWDEGFHLLPIIEWDLDLAISVLHSWLNLMDDSGWIGREQIFGPEARSRVPPAFQTQYPHYANPPTLLSLALPLILSKLTGASPYNGHPSMYLSSPSNATSMLNELYPLLTRHYTWFRRTQAGNFSGIYPRPASAIPGTGFRWRGRTPTHTLTSGLDDYPRADPPHPGELHVDALAWVGASAMALEKVAEYLGKSEDGAVYKGHVADVKRNLEVLHWDGEGERYCDTTVGGAGYELVCHEGYVSLMPLLLGFVEGDHPGLGGVLDLVADPERLWSPFGLRSLSKGDELYGRDEDYWRGAVWVNLNVLAVLGLRDVGLSGKGPAAVRTRALSLAGELRERVVTTVYDSWNRTGFFWEQYDDKTGEGRRSRAFTGWTATVILLMGLRLTQGTDEGKDASSGGTLTGLFLFGMVGFAVLVVVACALRRRLLNPLAGLVNSGVAWVSGQRTRGYEQVIDLDERGV